MQWRILRKVRHPQGQCYQVAGQFIIDEREGILVHGRVWSAHLQKKIDHAWVELPVGTTIDHDDGTKEVLTEEAVVDLTLNKKLRLIPKRLYFALTGAEETARYSLNQICLMRLKHNRWGPWPCDEDII